MFLLTTKTRHHTDHRLFNSFQSACAAAREFVGEHYEADGCSTQPRLHVTEDMMVVSRSTSFGTRDARVEKISDPED